MKTSRWLARASVGMLVYITALFLWVAYSLLWPFNPLTMNEGSWTTTKKQYAHGEWVVAKLDYCQTMTGTPRLDFTIEQGGRLIPLVPAFGNDRAMCEKREFPILQIPVNALLDNGTMKILVTITYRINPLREVVYRFETNEFEVTTP